MQEHDQILTRQIFTKKCYCKSTPLAHAAIRNTAKRCLNSHVYGEKKINSTSLPLLWYSERWALRQTFVVVIVVAHACLRVFAYAIRIPFTARESLSRIFIHFFCFIRLPAKQRLHHSHRVDEPISSAIVQVANEWNRYWRTTGKYLLTLSTHYDWFANNYIVWLCRFFFWFPLSFSKNKRKKRPEFIICWIILFAPTLDR